ncbi:mCG1039049 [Mus musculus]|nr:mCG1039049 [Mus musculus]
MRAVTGLWRSGDNCGNPFTPSTRSAVLPLGA